MKKTALIIGILLSFYLSSCESRKAETNDNSQNSGSGVESGEGDNEANSATGSGGTVDPAEPGAGVEEGSADSTLNNSSTQNE